MIGWLLAFWAMVGLGLWVLAGAYPGALNAAAAQQDLVYLLAFLVLIGSSVLASFRGRFGQAVRMALVWALILTGLVAIYSWRDEATLAAQRAFAALVPSEPIESGQGEVTVRMGADGHFRVWAEIEGERVELVVDTGASTIALTMADARRVGVDPEGLRFDQPVITANGRAVTAAANLSEVRIGPIKVGGVPARIMPEGTLDRSLLGMSFLSRLDSMELSGSRLVMRQ